MRYVPINQFNKSENLTKKIFVFTNILLYLQKNKTLCKLKRY